MLNEYGTEPVENIVDIAAGRTHSVVLNKNGTAYAVGYNAHGELGDGTNTNKQILSKVEEVQNITQISAGQYHTTMLRGDSTVWVVGRNYYGELGINSTSTSSTASAQGVTIARQTMNQDKNDVLKNITQIASGGWHNVALTRNKQVYTWGYGLDGQLGTNTKTSYSFPQLVLDNTDGTNGIGGIQKIGASERITFLITENNQVLATGENSNYQLSQNNTTDLGIVGNLLSQDGENYIEDIINVPNSSANTNNTAVIKADGSVWVAGLGAKGQIGNNEYITATVYTRFGSSAIKNENSIITLAVGGTEKLNIKLIQGFNVYEDEQDSLGSMKYTSQNPDFVTVNAEGLVTALKQGSSRITITDETNMLCSSVLVEVTRDKEDIVQAEIEATTQTILLKTDGTVWSYGDNTAGGLGMGDMESHTEIFQVLDPNGKDKLSNVKNISSGYQFAAAVKQDGRVVTWGLGTSGQLGNGENISSSIPVYVVDSNGDELTDVIKVSCGYYFSIALKEDGTVWAWGSNIYGQLGINSGTNQNVAVQVKDTTGSGYLIGICDITTQAYTSHALTAKGEVYGWGYNYYGQIGNGTRNTGSSGTGRGSVLPKKLSLTDVVKIVGGYHHTMALKNDGTVWTWGLNRYGTLGYGNSSTSSSSEYLKSSPVQVKLGNTSTPLTNVIDIGTSNETSYAITADGNNYGWGYNYYGNIGSKGTTGSSGNYNLPQTLKERYSEIYTGTIVKLNRSTNSNINSFIQDDGTIMGSGRGDNVRRVQLQTDRTYTQNYVIPISEDYLEIDNRISYIKQGETTTLNAQVNNRLNAFIGHIKVGNLNWTSSNPEVAMVSNDGQVTSVGLGKTTITVRDVTNGYTAQAQVIVTQNNEKVITMPDISQGRYFTVILKADGSVWTTGINTNGQCGDGTTVNRTKPVRVKINSKEYLKDIVKIAAGEDHAVAVSKTGEVYAWGYNDTYQLGNGTTTKSVYATKVLNTSGDGYLQNAIDVSCGYKFTIILLKDGSVLGFGRNAYGELGTLNNSNKSYPTKMDGIYNAVDVQAGSNHSIIQKADGTVWATGYNYYGTLGQDATNKGSAAASQGRNYANPVINETKDAVLRNVTKISSGAYQNIVLTTDGNALVWGYNNVGQLGTGNSTNFAYPIAMTVNETTEILSDKVIDIGGSANKTIVKTEDESGVKHVLITGQNTNGSLGVGNTTNVTRLVPVMNTENTKEADGLDILQNDSRSFENTGYIDLEGNVWTAGLNTYGQIGDDTVYQRNNIVQIGDISLIADEIIFTMKPNESKQINTSIEDSFNVYIKDIKPGTLTYESLDESIATVNESGLVTAKSVGNTFIKITDTSRDIQTAVYIKVIKDQNDMKYEPMVDGGNKFSVALKGDGTVWAWGYNNYGQLGNNSTATSEIPSQVKGLDGEGFLTDIQMISCGTDHVLALKEDGTVWAWGYNNYGQLGDNTQIKRYTPVQVMAENGDGYLQDIIYIQAGANYSVAINKKGEVWTWGQNDVGQLGDGSKVAKYTPVRVKANLSGVVSVACGAQHTVALKADGTVYAWGNNTYGQLGDNTKTQKLIPVRVLETADSYIDDAVAVSSTQYSSHILTSDGEIYSVGLGTSGQLGDNTKVTKQLPVKVVNTDNSGVLTGITAIKSGANTTYALSKEGKVYAWGIGTNGELGNNTYSNSLLPVSVKNGSGDEELSNILYIGAGANHGLAVENSGYVEVWGLNDQKQAGDPNSAKVALPIYIGSKIVATPNNVTINVSETQKVTVNMDSFNLFKANGDLDREIEFTSLNQDVATVDTEGTITGVKMGITKIVVKDSISGKVTTIEVSVLQNGAIATPKVVSGLNHTVALKADGTVWTWGYNGYGQLGNGTTTNSYVPEKIGLDNVIDIAAGDYFTLALKQDGTVWAWGRNEKGQLGQGNTTNSTVPKQVLGVGEASFLSGVTKIAACRYHWVALLDTTEVVSCGNNSLGELGDNTSTNRTTPVYMLNHNGVGNVNSVKDISIGQCETAILKEDGSLWMTGHNCCGGLGQGNTTTSYRIKQVKDTTGNGTLNNIIQISSGGWGSLALDSNGNVWSWGSNSYGQLGINSTSNKSLPQKVLGVNGTGYLENIVSVKSGYYSSFAVDSNGNVYSWGYNNNGQLGINNTTTYKVPKQVLSSNGTDLLDNVMIADSNGYHSTFVKYDGTVWTVGYNKNGELGNDGNVSTKLVECISNPKLEVKEKYVIFDEIGQTKKIEVSVNSGFNLLVDTIEAGTNTFRSLNRDVVEVDQYGNIISTGAGTTYIKITNEELGLIAAVKVVVPVRDAKVAPKIVGGANHYVALKADGTVWTWGYNGYGQLGQGNTSNYLEPTKTTMSDVIDVAAGANFTAVLKKDGTVWVAGQNNYGQLGQGNTTGLEVFTKVKAENGTDYLSDIIAISASNYYMVALKKDGTVYAWGLNTSGQLGIGSTSNIYLPTKVRKVNNIIDMSAGSTHLVLLDADGTVWATGQNNYGQLGNKTTTNATIPAKVLNTDGTGNITDIIKVAGGEKFTVLLSEDGKVYSFGYNNYGQLAINSTTKQVLPVLAKDVDGLNIENAIDIEARQYTASIVRKDRTVWTVGYNEYGAAGNGTTVTNKLYTQVLGEKGEGKFEDALLSSTTNNSLVTADNLGRVYTSGYNSYGQLGDKTLSNSKYLIGISKTSLQVKESIVVLNSIGETNQIEASMNLGFNILYDNLENETYTYKSLNTNIVTVSDTGLITAVKYGDARIEVTNIETGNTATVIVKVVREGDISNPKIKSGIDFNIALKANGTVWSWGYNEYGQLGTNDNVRKLEPSKIEIDNVVDIACGNNHTLFLKEDGTVWATGLNNYGQLGNNKTTNSNTPVQVTGLKNIIRITAGANHSLALDSDGTVYAWGYNGYGQLGDTTTTRRSIPVEVRKLTKIKEISAGNHSSIALDIDGNVYVWGLNTSGQLGLGTKTNVLEATKLTSVSNILQIESGINYNLLVTESGEVYSFGINGSGQLGNGTTTNSLTPVKVKLADGTDLTNIESVSAGTKHVLAKTYDGTAYGWGLDSNYQFGDEVTITRLNPEPIKYSEASDIITEILEVDAGDTHSSIVKEDGTVWVTGKNSYGQLGNGTTITSKSWICISDIKIKVQDTAVTIPEIGGTYQINPQLNVGFNLLYDDMKDGDFAYASNKKEIVDVSDIGVITGIKRGKTKVGITETNTQKTIYIDVYVLEKNDIAFPALATTEYSSVALKSDGTVWTWGLNTNGELGLGDNLNRLAPTKVDIDNVVRISVSTNHVLALRKDGTVYAWGLNTNGQLGTGDNTSSNIPVQVKANTESGYLENIKEISTATNMSMALDESGNVYTWGLNDYGQLGLGNKTSTNMPTILTEISNVTKIEGGNKSAYAITDEGNVYSWGYNSNGQLGDGTNTIRTSPVKVSNISGIIDISASTTDQVLALKDDGTVWGWGYASLGALTDIGGSIPKQIMDTDGTRMKGISSISSGYYASLVITDNGEVLAFGNNGYGELGLGNTVSTQVPKNVIENEDTNLSNVFIAQMGKHYSLYAKEDGSVWATGYNEYGQLGNTSTVAINIPENISSDYLSVDVLELTFNNVDESKKINATYNFGFNLYDYTDSKDIEFSSQDDSIAIVDSYGNVTSKGIGKTYIDIESGSLARRVEINVLKADETSVMDTRAGGKHTVGLKTNGTIWTFGDNSYGQCGVGEVNNINYTSPQEVLNSEGVVFTKIAVGKNHTLALDNNGNVYAFGANSLGQLGNSTGLNSGVITKIEGLEDIVQIECYENTSMAINSDGELYIWGEGYTPIPTKLNFYSKIIDISGKLILSEYGTVWNLNNINQKVPILTNIVEIASGDSHYLALASDGKVYAWGNNSYGQLGLGSIQSTDTPTKITKLPDVESIKAGQYNSYVLTKDNEVYSFGRNSNGSLGLGITDNYVMSPARVTSSNVERISAGQNYATYVADDGFVYSWGTNTCGQLGHGDKLEKSEPTLIGSVKIINKDNTITIKEGEDYTINATLNNTFNLRQDIIDSTGFTFNSIDEKIATVSNGIIKGVSPGLTTVVISHNSSNNNQNIYIEVLDKDVDNAKSVIDVKTANDFSIALKIDGTIWSWGLNTNGQLALGNNVNTNIPSQIKIEKRIVQTAVGSNHIVVLTEEGKVYSAGLNTSGQLGNGTLSNSNTLVEVIDEYGKQIENIARISAVENTTYLLDYDGNIYACGNGYNKLALKLEKLDDISAIYGNYGITKDNKVINLSTKEAVDGLENIIKIAVGTNHVIFLKSDGTAYAMGTNTNGQCGNGTKVNCLTPTVVRNSTGTSSLTDIKDIDAGENFSIAVLQNGEVYTWGSNENNKLGTDQVSDQVLPKKIQSISDGIIVSAGTNSSTYVNSNGKVYDWGLGVNGTLGNGVNANSIEKVLVGTEDVIVSTNHLTIQKSAKQTLTAKVKSFNLIKDETSSGITFTSNDKSVVKVDSLSGEVTGLEEGTTSITVSQDGTDNISIVQVSVIREGIAIKPSVQTVNSTQVILKYDGTVWTYGLNTNGECGIGNNVSSDNLRKVTFDGTNAKIVQIAVGESHVMALDENGYVWTWGRNQYLQLGKDGITSSNIPVKVDLDDKIVKIAAGYNSSFGITENNELIAWGLNTDGQLGVGNYDNRILPTKVETMKNVLDVQSGKSHTMLLTTNGIVWTVGNNSFGALTGTEYKRNTFAKVENLENVAYISSGEYHNMALTTNRKLYVWGYNVHGQLGINSLDTTDTPVQITDITGIKEVSAGRFNSTIVTKDGKLYVAGLNTLGQLGDGTSDYKQVFTESTTISDVYSADSGDTYMMSIKNDGTVWAWGDYYHGTSDIRTVSNSNVPVQIGNQGFSIRDNDISVNIEGTKQIEVNSQFEFNVFKDNIQNSDYEYVSLNTSVATVDNSGTVTGVKVGTTWVKVTEKTTGDVQIVIVRVIEKDNKVAPRVDGGNDYTVVLKADGSLWSFGYNSNGELGNGSLNSADVPKEVNILKSYTNIAIGGNFGLALRNDGNVWSFGLNNVGQLGLGDRNIRQAPTLISNIINITKIAVGKSHAVALGKYGEVYTWGYNDVGQLGTGDTKIAETPTLIEVLGANIVDIAAGDDYTVLVDANGKLYVFGNTQSIIGSNCQVPTEVTTVTNVAKVACGKELIVLTKDGNVQKVASTVQDVYTLGNAIDITAKNDSYMILTNDAKVYNFGTNSNGELGIGSTSAVSTPVQAFENVNSIGSGMNNTYVITNSGLVYASGLNTYGALGNGTKEPSQEYTLVGTREIKATPENILMSVNDVLEIEIESVRYNVLKEDARTENDFELEILDTDIATVESENEIKAVLDGETTLTITMKDTGAEEEVKVVVVPLDAQRIEKLSVNAVDAQVSGVMKYEVTIATDENTGNLLVTTKDTNDKISIDGGITWYEKGTLIETVNLPDPSNEIDILVETENGTQFSYTLTVIKQSNIVDLEHLYVNDIEATATSSTEYSIIVEDIDDATIKAVTTDINAKVGIDGNAEILHEDSKDVSLKDIMIKTVPIKVIAESGKEVNYVLTIYKQSAVTELESLKVDGIDATKNNFLEYSIMVDKNVTEVNVQAIALYDLAGVDINSIGEETKESTRKITLTEDTTQVKIKVTAGTDSKEYTLTIIRKPDATGLGLVYVNGVEIKQNSEGIYETFIANTATNAEVQAIASVNTSTVQIGTEPSEVGSSTVTVNTPDLVNTYTITVTNSEDISDTATYTLLIKKPSTDNTLKEITVSNDEMSVTAVKESGSNIYRAKINAKITQMLITAITNYELAEVKIDTNEYKAGQDTLDITFTGDTYSIEITVKAQDGTEAKYTLILERLSSNVDLEFVKVNGVDAILSTSEVDTYEITLKDKETEILVDVKALDENTNIAINNIAYELGEIEKTVQMDSKDITVKINVKAEDGTLKTYNLIIYGLPDNTKAKEITVNGIKASLVPYTNKYQVRVPKTITEYTVEAISDDSLAYVKIAEFTANKGISTQVINKDVSSDTTTVNINILAQDGATNEDYLLEITTMSDNSKLAYLKVDGNIIDIGDDGEYHTKVGTSKTQVNIEALTDDMLSTVGIGDAGTSNTIIKTESLAEDITIFNIIVTAEDGTKTTYKLNIEKMSNNTDIEIYVNGTLVVPIDGKYEVKIGNDTQATVKGVTIDENAYISIDGNTDILHENTEDVSIISQEKKIEIVVTAEDGTIKTHYLTLKRNSSDNSLLSISAQGVSEDRITQTGEKTYQMIVSNELTTLNLTAVTSDSNAKVKIDTNEYEVNVIAKEISLPDDVNKVTITVQAEDGSEKEYTLTIIKKYLLTLDTIVVEGDIVTLNEEGEYIAWIDPSLTSANVTINPTSNSVNVEAGNIATGTGSLSFTLNTEEDETTLKIVVSSPVEEDLVEYTLKVIKKSSNTELEYVKVEGKVGTEFDGEYTVKVPIQTEKYHMDVKTVSAYAQVKIEDNEYSIGTDSYDVDMTDVISKKVSVTVKAQDGTIKQYMVNIEKISSDNTLKIVKINGVEIEENNKEYRAFIKPGISSVPLYLETTHEGALIQIDDETEVVHTKTETITIDEQEETISVKVTAEDGSIQLYTVYITVESSDVGVESVKVDGKSAILTDEDTYYISATPGASKVEITVTAANQYATVQVDTNVVDIGTSTVTYTLPNETKVVSVPFTITAQDGVTTKTYTLEIEQVSNNTNLSVVKVNDKDITESYDETTKTYLAIIDYSVDESEVYVETENEEATVKIDTGDLSKHTVTESLTTVSTENVYDITIIAEDGTKEIRTLVIKKLSKDASIIRLWVNEEEIEVNEDGISYTAEVLESVKTSTLRIKTADSNTQIEIDGTMMEDKGDVTTNVNTDGVRQVVVTIKTIAEDGVTTITHTLTINIVSDNKEIEYVKANSVEITDYDEKSATYKTFIPAGTTSIPVEVKAISTYATVRIDGNEAVNKLTYTASTSDDITYVNVEIIAEDDSVKTYTVILQKISTDATLKELYKDGIYVDSQEDGNYLINVSEDTTKVNLKAIANNEYANVKIGTEEAQISISEREITLDSGKTTTVPIVVTAQDNTTTKTYTVTINKLSSNNEIEYVKVNSDDITLSYDANTKVFKTFIPANSQTATVDIKAVSNYATLECGDTIGTQLISNVITTDAEETTVEFTVQAENGVSATYYISLTKISTDNTIKEIYVDEKLISPDGDGKYIAEVLETNESAEIKLIANNQYATVSINNGSAKQGEATEIVELSKEKFTEVQVVVTSQNGEVLNEIVTIKKVSDNNSINTVLINGIECKTYDSDTKTYTAYIDETDNTAEVSVMAANNYATVVVDTTSGIGNVTTNVNTSLDITKVAVSVKSESGITEKYTINIIKKSADATAEIIKVNDNVIDDPYEVYVKKLDNKVKVYVKASNDKAYVKIADEEAEIAESTAILEISTGIDNVVIPVIITAQNGTTRETYNITLRRLSNETGIKEILVNDEIVDLNTFEHIVKNVDSVNVKVTTTDEEAKVSIDDKDESVNVANATVPTNLTTVRTIKVTAPDGTIKEYSLTLIKKTTITGKITDANIVGKHFATITVYQTDDTRIEGDLNNPREVIESVQTNADGTYEIVLEPGKYDIVFTEPGYLSYRVTDIDITDGLGATLDTIDLIAGDVVETGEIEIDDLVAIGDNYGTITDENKPEKEKYDLNGDGIVNSLDRSILKKNYGKKAEIVKWVDPDKQVETASINSISTYSSRSASISNQDFILPMSCSYVITSPYGYRVHPVTGETKFHSGIDISGTWHTEIFAVADGEVTYAGVQSGYGNCIEIKHTVNGETVYSFYAHLSQINVTKGQKVKQGEVIGLEGGDPEVDPNPGTSTGHHLHFEMRNSSGSGNSIDPNNYISF